MKKYLIIILVLINYISLKAQSTPYRDTLPWAPLGATWFYHGNPNMAIKHERDSMINIKQVKAFDFYGYIPNYYQYPIITSNIEKLGTEYLYSSNDTIYLYDKGLGKFVFLYDFNVEDGDIWHINTSYVDCLVNNTVVADHNVSMRVNNIILNDTLPRSVYYSAYEDNMNVGPILPRVGSL